MMNDAQRWIALSAVVLAACSHDTPPSAKTARAADGERSLIFFEAGSSGFGGEGRKASLLARGYVRPREKLASFSYYVYLLFLDRSPTSQPYRKAAALAFINLFDDVSHISLAPHRSRDLAVILAPVKAITAAPATWEQLLSSQTYDYASAELIGGELRKTGHSIPRVALIASTSPLGDGYALPKPDALRVVAACGGDEQVAAQFLKLREALKEGKAGVAGPSMSDWIRTLFRSLGELVAGGTADPKSSALPDLTCPPL